ncbi:hybrid sensor histidine kinase/response regulator [Schlesneria paludicola]|uniref:hybrid sensor histidine kinase/response regulator n=1 Tax=Schlesneria paludicola TaxID=360056 RepID=UPI00029A30E2|nr:PAS domain S-box protein [Schlesneria paludicola]
MWPPRRKTNLTAICLVGCVLLVMTQWSLPDSFSGMLTSLLFLGMIFVASVIGGWKGGVVATTCGLLCALFLFSPPYIVRAATKPIELFRLSSFVFLGAGLSAIGELLQRAWRRIEERQRLLEDEVQARRRAQLAERARADELMTTLASIGDGVIRTDREGRVTFLNPVAEKLVGWQSPQAAGRPLSEVFHIVHETTRQPVPNPALQSLADGDITALANHTLLISRDGTERPIDDSAAPIRDATGNIIGSVLIFRDVTERQRGHAAVLENERRYRAIGESIDYGVWVCDATGRNTYISESFLRLVGLTQEEYSHDGPGTILHPDDADTMIAAWQECVRYGHRWDRELRVKGVDGKWHSVLSRGVPVRNEQGELTSWVGINLDISRLKQVEAELRDADRRKDEFLATLAHELRNPLAPIANSLQILKIPSIEAETTQQTLEVMERQTQHLVRLVDDLLDVSRVMRGKIELRLERVELATIVTRAIETAKPLIDAQHHHLETSLPSESLPLSADPVRLTQVIGNLLTNSAKYSAPNGTIRVSARREGEQAVLSVVDNGIGIASDMLPQIFELFVQADQSSTKAQGGLGIGLTLVKNLVELHGGSVEAHSAGLAQGSEFVVRLPLPLGPPENSQATEPKFTPQVLGASGHKLLVIDDNKDAARSLAMLLQFKGHEVRVAYSGAEALELVQSYTPDLVLLDLGMPGMDGYEVSRRLRMVPELKNTLLVALTGWGQAEDRRRTADAGFHHHLVKPPEPGVLDRLLADLRNR